MATTPRYYTYLQEAKKAAGGSLPEGQMMHFTQGKGYWIGPRPSAAAPRQTPQPPAG